MPKDPLEGQNNFSCRNAARKAFSGQALPPPPRHKNLAMAPGSITDTKRQQALLLYTAGPKVEESFKQISNNGDDNGFKMAKEKLTEYFQPQTNRQYEVYGFRQNQEESLDQFHTRLRTLVQNCEFAENNLKFEIEQQILVGGTSSRID